MMSVAGWLPLVGLLMLSACGSQERQSPNGDTGGFGGAGADGGGGSAGEPPAAYDADPAPLEGAACDADQAAHWTWQPPATCSGLRTCVDARMRYWVDEEPFFPRGVYNGGYEYAWLLSNCPAGAACAATNPADEVAYVQVLVDAGFNLIMDRSRYLVQPFLDAIHAAPQMKIAHLLWSDPFTTQGHDDMVADITAAAADPDVVMWFGPDEVDLWDNWSMAAGIRRLLRGASPELDALLTGKYAPGGTPYLPMNEPAHDPHGLPFGAALAYDPGLAAGTDVYDLLLPITYPFEEPYSLANEGIWGTWRISEFADEGVPVVPILQMVGIDSMGLSQPSSRQIEAQIVSALAHGATGLFYFNLIGDNPKHAGRDGWFAPDLVDEWESYRTQHALLDRLLSVLYGDAREQRGQHEHLEWRSWTLADRTVFVIANPTPYERVVDLDAFISLPTAHYVRHYDGCTPFTQRELMFPAYGGHVLEVYP